MTFAEKLRQLRRAAGLSEARLAERSGVSFGAVHNYGLGLRQPTFRAVVRLARALGVTCEAFAVCVEGAPPCRPAPRARRVRPRGAALADGPRARRPRRP